MKRYVTGKVLLFTKKNGCFFSRVLSSAPELPARVLARRAHVAEAYFEVGGPALAGRGERAVARAPERRLARLAARVFFIARVARAPRLAIANPGELGAHVHARVFLVRARVRRDPPRAGKRQVVQRRVLIARRELQVAVHGVDAVVPLSSKKSRAETEEAGFRQSHSPRRESVRPLGAIENESVEFDIRPTRG